ncbi:unnamed protein product [Rotaria magnacalcarata]|uniref:Uncharacterized protein n=1 Tax=Rotaria magnacalcarata TaxID=392030 RepID=A0A819AMD4_9BILA|nr:unnamed protein product [Rotaria magnacalcarata]CAF3779763.1 unnamed protein product [Rotaria magnacalcarata]
MIPTAIFLFYFSWFLNTNLIRCVQPYFPSQITFSIEDGNKKTLMAIADVNQQAYQTYISSGSKRQYAFVMEKFPYTIPDITRIPTLCSIDKFEYIEQLYLWYNLEIWLWLSQHFSISLNTDVVLQTTRVVRRGWVVVQETTKYKIISIDTSLGLLYYPQTSKVIVDKSLSVQIWLTSPPHRIYGNDALLIEWQPDSTSESKDCVTWKPERLYFNSMNFEKRQELVITRIKSGGKQRLIPIPHGGGYETVYTGVYPIFIE